MRTTRDAHGLILRSLGWKEYAAGTTAMTATGWVPPDEVGPEERQGERLPENAWDTVNAMQRVTVEAFALIEMILEVAASQNEHGYEFVRLTANNPGQDFSAIQDVDYSIEPAAFQAIWHAWVGEIVEAAPGARRDPDEAAQMVAAFIEQKTPVRQPGVPDMLSELEPATYREGDGMPMITQTVREEPVADVGDGMIWSDRMDALTSHLAFAFDETNQAQESMLLLAADWAEAQRILDEGGKGARRRALQQLGFRT